MSASIFGYTADNLFMQEAYKEAEQAFNLQEVPIGAIVVDEHGTIIGRGHNKSEQLYTQAAHAEIEALSLAGRHRKNWRLNNCWLYVTLEPCKMCMGMMQLSRIKGLIYGAPSPLFSYKLDKDPHSSVYQSDMLIISGLHTEKISTLLQCFFKQQRM